MTTGVGGGKRVVLGGLFADLYGQDLLVAALVETTAATFVEDELGAEEEIEAPADAELELVDEPAEALEPLASAEVLLDAGAVELVDPLVVSIGAAVEVVELADDEVCAPEVDELVEPAVDDAAAGLVAAAAAALAAAAACAATFAAW